MNTTKLILVSISSVLCLCSCNTKKEIKTFDVNNPYFGSYPQSRVEDETLINSLNNLAGNRPTEGMETLGNWKSFNYYADGEIAHFMWHIDISHSDGNKYRGVYFTSYRPNFTTDPLDIEYSYQDENGYFINTTYWFKYEPILWDVIDNNEENKEALVFSHIILDSQQFYKTGNPAIEHPVTRNVIGTDPVTGENWNVSGIYENNYKYSDIRMFSNTIFYNDAFDESERNAVLVKTIDNSPSSTEYKDENAYACEDTQDRVFIPSFGQVTNTGYGFAPTYDAYDPLRRKKSTDYAHCMGTFVYVDEESPYHELSTYWLRSPDAYESYYANDVYHPGEILAYFTNFTSLGYMPASYFKY